MGSDLWVHGVHRALAVAHGIFVLPTRSSATSLWIAIFTRGFDIAMEHGPFSSMIYLLKILILQVSNCNKWPEGRAHTNPPTGRRGFFGKPRCAPSAHPCYALGCPAKERPSESRGFLPSDVFWGSTVNFKATKPWFLSTQQQDKQLHQKEYIALYCPYTTSVPCSIFRAVNVVEFSEGLAEISPQAWDSPGNGEVGCFSSGLYWPRWPQFHMRWAAPVPGFEGARSHISSYFDICLGEF